MTRGIDPVKVSKYGTPFLDSELMLAATVEDWVEVRRLLGELLTGERRNLRDTLEELRWEMEQYESDQRP